MIVLRVREKNFMGEIVLEFFFIESIIRWFGNIIKCSKLFQREIFFYFS